MEEGGNFIGVKRAALRRAELELGIRDLKIEDLTVGSRILYKASSCEMWGEYELDYLVFAKKDIEINPNPSEVKSTRYINLENLEDFENAIKEEGSGFTPWFSLIKESRLEEWWKGIKEDKFPREEGDIKVLN